MGDHHGRSKYWGANLVTRLQLHASNITTNTDSKDGLSYYDWTGRLYLDGEEEGEVEC